MTYDFYQNLILVKLSENKVRSLQSTVLTEVSENLKCSSFTDINLPPFFQFQLLSSVKNRSNTY